MVTESIADGCVEPRQPLLSASGSSSARLPSPKEDADATKASLEGRAAALLVRLPGASPAL